jgi:hypothetical protein
VAEPGQTQTDERAYGGETPRPGGLLQRAPSERYGGPREAEPVVADVRRALLYGAGGAIAGVIAWVVASLLFDLILGLVVVAAAIGGLVGGGVSAGAWRGQVHVKDRRPQALAAGLAVGAVIVAIAADWFIGLLTLPRTTQPLGDRIATAPLTAAFTEPGLLYPMAMLVAALAAWRSAR